MSALPRIGFTVFVMIACVGLFGCGDSTSHHSSAAIRSQTQSQPLVTETATSTAVNDPNSPVVVRIGESAITKAGLSHSMQVLSSYPGHEVPVPPDFNACIIALHRKEPIDQGGEGRAANTLKGVCKDRYDTLLQTAITSLINNAWLTNEAARDGIKLDRPALADEFSASSGQFAQRPAGFQGYLNKTGRTVADFKFELEVGQLSGKIYQFAERKTPVLTQTRVARYYAAHKHDFALPEARDLYILHTKSAASALQAKREIRSGESFASAVKSVNVAQPLGAKKGLTLALTRKSYAEPELSNAIFNARPGDLSGPIRVNVNPAYEAAGYYIFQVKRVIPAHQMPFAAAAAIIKKEGPEQLHKKTLASFVKAYKARWKAKTDCSPGYVVEQCRQHKGPAALEAHDPYVL